MAIKWKGSTAVQIHATGSTRDPLGNNVTTITYVGTAAAIAGIEASVTLPGYSSRRWQDGPVHWIEVSYNDGAASLQWEIHTELIDRSLFTLPEVMAEIAASGFGAGYKKQIEDQVANGDSSLDSSYAALPYAQKVFISLSRGVEFYQDECLVLRRTQSVPADFSTPMNLTLGLTRRIYLTSELPALPAWLSGIPGTAANPFPTNPPQAEWGWRMRTRQGNQASRRAERITEWVLAAWDTLPYSLAGAASP